MPVELSRAELQRMVSELRSAAGDIDALADVIDMTLRNSTIDRYRLCDTSPTLRIARALGIAR
jgi:hypothetical protein